MRRPLPVLLLAAATAVSAADGYDPPEVRYENRPYNGKFTFARVKFRPAWWGPGNYMWGLDLKWNHDYPRAEAHFTKILSEITTVDTNVGGGNVLAIDDPELTRYPLAYLCEPGFLTLNEKEAAALRAYLLKGGFMIVDDFAGRQWDRFAYEMSKALPGSRFIELPNDHPIFDSFFRVEDPRAFPHPYFRAAPNYLALYEDNDPNKRMMMVVNYDQDVSEYWEWSDTGELPIELANEAYKLGVDYVIYGMTH